MTAVATWTLNPLQLAPLALLAWCYWYRVRELARRDRPPPALRQTAFYAGVVVLAMAVTSPIDRVGEDRLFYVHMVQHLLLGDVAPLLIALGLTGPVLRPLLAIRAVRRLRVLAHPLVALPLWAVNLWAWHLAALYEAALGSPVVHAVEHAAFFATGLAMWAAVVEPLPGPAWFGSGWKAAYTLVVRTIQAGLANVFLWSSVAFYDSYAAGERAAGISAQDDQAIAGGIMLVEGAVVTLVVFAWLFLRWTGESERAQAMIDTGADPGRSARAARYGRSTVRTRTRG
ncbi:MAG: cytochrome c oxidase assembly protein [Thermoleophilaceae bacterium]